MPDPLTNLQTLVDSERFLANIDLGSLDEMLDARDEALFESEWIRVEELVQQHSNEASPAVDAMRESAYKRAYAITQSPDACGYISDDFGLIADAVCAGVSDPWLSALVASYACGRLPHGELPADSRSISEIVAEFGT